MKYQPELLLSFLLLIFFTAASSSTPKFSKIPRLSPVSRTFLHNTETLSADSVSDGLETFFYNQTLGHFNYRPESYSTFQQRYFVDSKYWGGPNAPIFVYFGAEVPLDNDLIRSIGFLSDNALQFKALQVYIEVTSHMNIYIYIYCISLIIIIHSRYVYIICIYSFTTFEYLLRWMLESFPVASFLFFFFFKVYIHLKKKISLSFKSL